FTATVTAVAPGGGNPSGTVTFKRGSLVLGTGTLSTTNGVTTATYTTTPGQLITGTNQVTAVYAGDGNFTASNSSALTQTVTQTGTTTSVASSANPSVYGQPVTFTATVAAAAPGGGNPTGTVKFWLGGVGGTLLGTGTLGTSNGVTTASYTTTAGQLPVGAGQTVTAEYGGDVAFTASSGTASQTANQARSTPTAPAS